MNPVQADNIGPSKAPGASLQEVDHEVDRWCDNFLHPADDARRIIRNTIRELLTGIRFSAEKGSWAVAHADVQIEEGVVVERQTFVRERERRVSKKRA